MCRPHSTEHIKDSFSDASDSHLTAGPLKGEGNFHLLL